MTPFPKTRAFRLSDSHLVFPVWQIIDESPDNQADLNRVVKALAKARSLTDTEVVELLEQLCEDGLVIMKSNSKTAIFSLPNLNQTKEKQTWDILQSRDCYCYECHGHGEVLVCSQCPRVFHPECIRPRTDLDLPLLPLREPVPDRVQDTFRQVFGSPYSKYRYGSSTPYPISGDEDAISAQNHRFCINCRMRKEKNLEMRDSSKLIPLLDSAFQRIRSWIALDTFSEQEPKSIHIPKKYVDTLGVVLFQNKVTADDIKKKIDDNVYESLVEFQCDIMDMVHCIGVLRGVSCAEFEAAKYLMLDALHEIIEISNCQDCYEHSAVQDNNEWFIKPCEPPHELVFAKQTGFSYWPAKVIRRTPTRVDVRFFGQQHTRAVIPLRNVKPIDQMPSIKRSVRLEQAMAELSQHRVLLKKLESKVTAGVEKTSSENEVSHNKLVPKRKLLGNKGLEDRISVDIVVEEPVVTAVILSPSVDIEEQSVKVDEEPVEKTIVDKVIEKVEQPIESEEEVAEQLAIEAVQIKEPPTKKRKIRQSRVVDDNDNSSSTFSDYQLSSVDLTQIDVLPFGQNPTAEVIENEDVTQNGYIDTINVNPDTNGAPHESTAESPSTSTSNQINGWECLPSPPALGTPIDVEPYISNMELAMIGCPQECIDKVMSHFKQYVRMVYAEMAGHAAEIMEAKLKRFCCICYQPAHYYCCQLSSYCSLKCQSLGWNKGHHRQCKRDKKAEKTDSVTQTDT